jgi:hypothetical protein
MNTDHELMLALGRLEGKMDALIQMQRIQEEQLKFHEERIRSLEHYKSFAMGIAALVGAVSSLIFSFLLKGFQ